MLSVAEARSRIIARLQPVAAETLELAAAAGRILAQPVFAPHALPPFANSAMDGYAVRAADVAAASSSAPVTLRVIEDIGAGQVPNSTLSAGTVARITTGALLPAGADAVIPVEWTGTGLPQSAELCPPSIRVAQPVEPGRFIRAAGSDVPQASLALPAGARLSASAVGLLAALGIGRVAVASRVRVAVLSTGNELVPLGAPLTAGKIHNSNSYTLAALIQEAGGTAIDLGIVPDSVAAVEHCLADAVQQGAQLIVSSAGVSMGNLDVVRQTLEKSQRVEFWQVNMRPGKPVLFGAHSGVPFLGLPGNPVSAIIAFELFARPALLHMSGCAQWERPAVMARVAADIQSDGRETYVRARVELDERSGELSVRTSGGQDSHMLGAMANANALLIIPAGVKSVRSGELLKALLLPS